MKELDFDRLNELATKIANYALADLETKEMIKDLILDHMAMACVTYSKSEDFKKEIAGYCYQRGFKW
ncbi:hypothetical protein [Bacillus infantis]|uniref:hypothetical protein n=1 Tax=Bacillus infantis TaxID=324767 RepID=UPI00209F2ECE|nr:hypothetical protein [Bacillus infantis]MCP1159381.1 hypothetical protein [Bacillus infantis]